MTRKNYPIGTVLTDPTTGESLLVYNRHENSGMYEPPIGSVTTLCLNRDSSLALIQCSGGRMPMSKTLYPDRAANAPYSHVATARSLRKIATALEPFAPLKHVAAILRATALLQEANIS
jgi:hypothetical protein